tara:strand:- start:45 stop:1193 length:1149 start_codon:yes stop_codon:yes gene_type:complete
LENKKKILIINHGLRGGGVERASTSLANYFADSGYNVQVLSLSRDEDKTINDMIIFKLNESVKYVEPEFNRNAVLENKHSLENKNIFSKINYVFKLIVYIRRKTKIFNPDTVLAFSEWTNPYVILALIGLKYPIYVSDRMSPIAKLPIITEILKRFTYRFASGIIAQTSFAKSILKKKTKSNRIYVINNPVNIINKTDDKEIDLIVSVGRLSAEKGHKYLIKAFSMIKNKDWKLALIGDGSQRQYLENLVSDLSLNGRVIFLGSLTNFSKYLTQAKIFILPSLKEGFPNSLVEAMAMGKATISSDFFDGDNEIIDNEINGILVSPGNINELFLATEKLINNNSLRLRIGQEAKKIAEKLEFTSIASQYLNTILKDEYSKTPE